MLHTLKLLLTRKDEQFVASASVSNPTGSQVAWGLTFGDGANGKDQAAHKLRQLVGLSQAETDQLRRDGEVAVDGDNGEVIQCEMWHQWGYFGTQETEGWQTDD